MNLKDIFKTKDQSILLSANQVVGMGGGLIHIVCQRGALFVTWPKGREKVLLSGEGISISSWGKICVMALSQSAARFQQKGLLHAMAFGHTVNSDHSTGRPDYHCLW